MLREARYSLTHKGEGKWLLNLFISLFSISIKKGDLVLPPVYQLSVPILYHIYKRLSSDLNTFFKNYLYYFLTHKREGISFIPLLFPPFFPSTLITTKQLSFPGIIYLPILTRLIFIENYGLFSIFQPPPFFAHQ